MAIQSLQQQLFDQETAVINSKKFKATTVLWNYFFEEHGLMLLDEHITGIIQAVKTYNLAINGENKTTNTDKERPY